MLTALDTILMLWVPYCEASVLFGSQSRQTFNGGAPTKLSFRRYPPVIEKGGTALYSTENARKRFIHSNSWRHRSTKHDVIMDSLLSPMVYTIWWHSLKVLTSSSKPSSWLYQYLYSSAAQLLLCFSRHLLSSIPKCLYFELVFRGEHHTIIIWGKQLHSSLQLANHHHHRM